MTTYRCDICDDPIDDETDSIHFGPKDEPLCKGCHDFLKEEGHLEEEEELQDAADEDERLDDPRHGQANDINRMIK